MHTKQLDENLFLIDLRTGGFKNLFQLILKGSQKPIIKTGTNLIHPKPLIWTRRNEGKT